MRNDTPLTLIGNLTDDPELRFTPSGAAVVRFTLASTPRVRKGDQWEDGEVTFMDCTAWRQLAENIAGSLTKGSRVVVVGKLNTQRWQNDDGERRSRLVLDVDDVGPSLTFGTTKFSKPERATSRAGKANGNTDQND